MKKKIVSLLTAAALALTSGAAFAQTYPSSVSSNLVINPWMEIDQVNEGTSTALTASAAGTYTYRKQGDGWAGTAATSASGITTKFQNSAVAPNGSVSDLLVTVGTGSATHADGTLLAIEQRIEPIRLAVLQYGTANAQPSYLSFCAKASIAGLYSVAIVGGASARLQDIHTVGSSWFHQFSIPTANQFSCYKFLVPGDTGGTWGLTSSTNTVDTTHGATLAFVLGLNGVTTDTYGVPTATAADGVWQNGAQNVIGVNSTNVAMDKTSGSTFELTGVKWSLDDTPLAHDVTGELQQAWRYLYKTFPVGTGGNSGTKIAQGPAAVTGAFQFQIPVVAAISGGYLQFPVPMRAAPTVTTYDPKSAAADSNCFDITGASTTVVSTVDPGTAVSSLGVYIKCAASLVGTAGQQAAIHVGADARM